MKPKLKKHKNKLSKLKIISNLHQTMKSKYSFIISILGLVILTSSISADGQEVPETKKFIKPDYNQIIKIVKDKNSNYYYPNLFKRYLEGDNSLTDMEKFYTYYGYITNDNYEPYALSEYEDSLHILINLDSLTTADTKRALFYLNDILEQDPFNIQMLLSQAFMYKSLKMGNEAQKAINKMGIVMEALSLTGDAMSKKTAIFVINLHQEYDYIYVMGLDPQIQEQVSHFDHFTLLPNDNNIPEMYFDISAFIDKQ